MVYRCKPSPAPSGDETTSSHRSNTGSRSQEPKRFVGRENGGPVGVCGPPSVGKEQNVVSCHVMS